MSLTHSKRTLAGKLQDNSAWPALIRVVLIAGLFAGTSAMAQRAIFTSPPEPLLAPLLRAAQPPASSSKLPDPTGNFFELGKLTFHPHLTYSYSYSLGTPAGQGRHVATVIDTLSPGLEVDAGPHWSLDYTPTWTGYTTHALNNTFGQSVRLSGAGSVQEWAVNTSGSYGTSSSILAETAQQTKQSNWGAQLGAARSFGADLGVDTSMSVNESLVESFPGSRNWATMDWLTLQLAQRVSTGLGLGLGYSEIPGRPDTYYESYHARLNFNPADKLTLGLNGGLETDHSWAAATKAVTNPVFDASLSYQAFTATSLSLGATQAISNSLSGNPGTKSSSWTFSLNQRLLGRFYFSASYSRQHTAYPNEPVTPAIVVVPDTPDDTSTDVPTDTPIAPADVLVARRSDHGESISVSISTQFLHRWSVSANYGITKNTSSLTGFTFSSTQFGFNLSCKY